MDSTLGRGRRIVKSALFMFAALLALSAVALACATGGDQEDARLQSFGVDESEVAFSKDVFVDAGMEIEVVREVEVVAEAMEAEVVEIGTESLSKVTGSPDADVFEEAASPSSADRVIVRSVEASVVVADISEAIEELGNLATSLAGWVIDSRRESDNFGFISFRVPAELLDKVMARVRDMVVEVETESGKSRDVTDEYVDLKARLSNQLATEKALLGLLDRAETVEEALDVQNELSFVREQVERLQGQIQLIQQTSSFSLVSLTLRRQPAPMTVDAGEDIAGAVGRPVRFRAEFRPPEGMENFTVTWNFGDGSQPVTSRRTAPTQDEDVRVTATVTHEYLDDQDSPYIVEVQIDGSGDGGLAEGSDVLIVSISRLPRIEVFAGDPQTVDAGETVRFSGSFTRPREMTDASYIWDFGDGTDPAEGSLAAGVTSVVAEHSYRDHRPAPYPVTLTVRGSSEAGEVESSDVVLIWVDEAPGWTIGGWSAADTWRSIIRILSGVGQVLVTVLFWLSILAPVWLAAIAIYIWRRSRRRSGSDGSVE